MLEMYLLSVLVVSMLSPFFCFDAAESVNRSGKWFFHRTATRYIFEEITSTETLPSSCVITISSLPTCRISRQLDVTPSKGQEIEKTKVAELSDITVDRKEDIVNGRRFLESSRNVVQEKRDGVNDTRSLSWREYFGLGYVTITRRFLHTVTAKFYNPSTVYSFHVRGCRPTKLPFKLPLCNINATSHPVNSFSKELHYVP